MSSCNLCTACAARDSRSVHYWIQGIGETLVKVMSMCYYQDPGCKKSKGLELGEEEGTGRVCATCRMSAPEASQRVNYIFDTKSADRIVMKIRYFRDSLVCLSNNHLGRVFYTVRSGIGISVVRSGLIDIHLLFVWKHAGF